MSTFAAHSSPDFQGFSRTFISTTVNHPHHQTSTTITIAAARPQSRASISWTTYRPLSTSQGDPSGIRSATPYSDDAFLATHHLALLYRSILEILLSAWGFLGNSQIGRCSYDRPERCLNQTCVENFIYTLGSKNIWTQTVESGAGY